MAAKQEERNFVAEAAALVRAARVGSLATVADGAPYVALVTPAVAADGSVLLLLSDLALHTQNLRRNPACALLLTGPPGGENPQMTPRVTLFCEAVLVNGPDSAARFLKSHSYAALYISFADFHLWRLIPKDAHFVGGFAAAADIAGAALQHEILAGETDF